MNLSIDFQNQSNNQTILSSTVQFFQSFPQQNFSKNQYEKNQSSTSEDDSLHKLNRQILQSIGKQQKQSDKKISDNISEYNSCKERLTEDLQQNVQLKYQIKKNNYINPFKMLEDPLQKFCQEMIVQDIISKKQLKKNKIQKKKNQINNFQISENNIQQQNSQNWKDKQIELNQPQNQNLCINILNNQQKQHMKTLNKIINSKTLSVKNLPPYSEILQKNILNQNIQKSPSTDFNQLENHRKLVNRVVNNVAYVTADNQMFSSSNQNSISSLWQKQTKTQQKVQVSSFSEDQQIILLELCDYFKFMISAFELSKAMYYKACRLFRKIYYFINNKDTTTYQFAAACITIYAKLQCQKLFNDHSKQFPNTNGLNEGLKEQIEKRYPTIQFKRIRVAESAILKRISFNLELEDNTVNLIDDICHKWTLYVSANENKINYPKLCMQIGNQNKDQRRNLLNVIFLIDSLQFFPDIVFYPIQMDKKSLQNIKIVNILTAIYINVYCSIFGEYRNHKSQKIQYILTKFIKKVLKLQESEIAQLKQMIYRSKQYHMDQHLKVVSLDFMQKVQKKITKKQCESISKIIHNEALSLKNFQDKIYNEMNSSFRSTSMYV